MNVYTLYIYTYTVAQRWHVYLFIYLVLYTFQLFICFLFLFICCTLLPVETSCHFTTFGFNHIFLSLCCFISSNWLKQKFLLSCFLLARKKLSSICMPVKICSFKRLSHRQSDWPFRAFKGSCVSFLALCYFLFLVLTSKCQSIHNTNSQNCMCK